MDEQLPSFADVQAAAGRLQGVARRTPLLESEALNALAGGRILLKAEVLQRTGSFKFRGAYNAISQIAAPAVVAYSSGNHAQGVAAAARLLGKSATIVMPADAPAIKVENTRAARRRDPPLRPDRASRARRSAPRSPPAAGRRWSGPTTIRGSSPARAPPGSSSPCRRRSSAPRLDAG